MAYSKFQTSKNGMFKVTTSDGQTYEFRKLSTKPLDPKLKAEGEIRARAMRVKFQRAVKTAQRRGLDLQQVVPVS